MTEPRLSFAVQASPDSATSWVELARSAEALGAAALLVSDHPGTGPAPHVALAAAAAVTSTIALGAYVTNLSVRHPHHVAADIATLDVVSGGRAVIGVGAGHTPAEWTAVGRTIGSPGERVSEMISGVEQLRALLDAESPTRIEPAPVQSRLPLLVGGNGHRVLRYAAEHADIVAVSGLGPTLADGHTHEPQWSTDQLDQRFAELRHDIDGFGRRPTIDALVQFVAVTDNRLRAAEKFCQHVLDRSGQALLSPSDIVDCPFVLIGTIEEISAQIQRCHERWGISRWTVRSPDLDAIGEVFRALDH
jgi:probable F420-dependent oxidoreductase